MNDHSDAVITDLQILLPFRLTGALPDSFEQLSSLVELRLGSNMFSGELKSFGDLEFLLQLDLSGKVLCDDNGSFCDIASIC